MTLPERMSARMPHRLSAVIVAACAPMVCSAALSFNVATTGWPNAAHRDAAVAAAQSAVNRYNAYGDFGNYNIYIYYNSGIPTAQASYLGSVGFGGTYPNERVMMHEMAHYLGSGTYGDPWDGARGEALIDQFDGIEASLNGDSAHFWPYGLNYDSEGSEINKQRHVAVLYAQRADMGIGSTANSWSATTVTQTASDPLGESGFNYAARWSDGRFAHPGAAYSTGNYILRTPASGNSFHFVGESLTVNNTNGINGGLLYKGSGTTGVTSFKNLILDGGYVRHASGSGDLFQLAGKVALTSSNTIDAAQGSIRISANIGGSGSLVKTGGFTLTLAGGNSYTGDTTISAGTLRLSPAAPVANYTFDNVSGSTVVNDGSGGSSMNGTLANGAAIVGGGKSGNAVTLSSGASVDINSPIIDMHQTGNWTVSAWVKTSTAGSSILTKGNGSGWSGGNTIFYLGDGSAGGSGGLPSAVRYAGGFFQAAPGTTAVNNNAWRLVTYVNNGGNYAIYVDGVAQTLSSTNNQFAIPDIGTVVRLGVSTNTVPSDGTVNYNGLLDSVQFYNQALSAQQVAAMFQGMSVGILPAATDVSIASGATLDVNGVVQQVASVNGPSGSSITLGAGRLIVDSSSVNSTFAGVISGAGGSLVKAGASTLTLGGSNTYTGGTTISGGTLRLTSSAFVPVTGAGAAGAILDGGTLVMDYTGGTSPRALLVDDPAVGIKANAANHSNGRLRTTLALGSTKAIGWLDGGNVFQARYTHKGDINLDGLVDSTDFASFVAGYGMTSGAEWSHGDFDLSGPGAGIVDTADFNYLAGNFGAPPLSSILPAAALGSIVPEPASSMLLLISLGLHPRLRRRQTPVMPA